MGIGLPFGFVADIGLIFGFDFPPVTSSVETVGWNYDSVYGHLLCLWILYNTPI